MAQALVLLDSSVYGRGDWIASFTDGQTPWEKKAHTDQHGAFSFAGVGQKAMLLGAEHPRGGRATFQRIPAGADDVTVEITLRQVASLEGLVRRQGAPAVADITLTPQGEGGANRVRLSQTSGADGFYRFARLVPGRYQLVARRKTLFNQRTRKLERAVEIPARGRRLDVDLPSGPSLRVLLRRGEEQKAAVHLCPGEAQVTTMRALDRMQKSGALRCEHTFLTSGMDRSTFHDLAPGPYSVCVWVIPSRHAPAPRGSRDTWCQRVKVAASPAAQSMSLTALPGGEPGAR